MKILLIYCAITIIYYLLFGKSVEEGIYPGMESGSRGARFAIHGSFNVMAGVLAIFIGYLISIVSEKEMPRYLKIISSVIMAVSLVLLSLTLSRSGLMGVGLLVLLYLILKNNRVYLYIFLGIGVPLLILSGIGNKFLGNYQELVYVLKSGDFISVIKEYQTLFSRALLWDNAISDLLTNWSIIIGRGAGAVEQWVLNNTELKIIHSEVIGNFLNFGVIGCLLLFASFFTMFKQGYGLIKGGSSPWARAIGLATMLSLAATIPKFLWDVVLISPSGWLLVAICGLAGGVNQIQSEQETAANKCSPINDEN